MDQRLVSVSETLAYIEDMLGELLKLARNTDQRLLIYLIDMALQEARENQETETPVNQSPYIHE